jgi:aconitate hydratase
MSEQSLDSFKCRKTLKVGNKSYVYYSLKAAEKNGLTGISKLPYSLKVLLENLLRHEDGRTVTKADIEAMAKWVKSKGKSTREIAFRPARVLMQDFTGVPAVVDLAAMRDAMENLGGNPKKINPLAPVDLVIDHSVMVDFFGTAGAFKKNVNMEYDRNGERYKFLKWGQDAFDNFRVVPPGTGICHQVNLEYLAKTVWTKKQKVNGKGGYGCLSGHAGGHRLSHHDGERPCRAGLGRRRHRGGSGHAGPADLHADPGSGRLQADRQDGQGHHRHRPGAAVVEMLREKGVVGKFVEFYGPGLGNLSLEDQATIANMAPEYGATCGFFPTSKETLDYLTGTGRAKAQVDLVEKYAKTQGMFRTRSSDDPVFTSTLELDLGDVVPALAGPKRPQDRVALSEASESLPKP